MVSSSGNANLLRLKRNGNGLSRFISDVRTTSLCDDWPLAGAARCRSTSLFATSSRASQSCSVVVEKRLLHRGVPGCLPSMPPNDRFEPRRWRARPPETEISAISFNPLENVGK